MKKYLQIRILAILGIILISSLFASSPSHVDNNYYRLRIIANSDSVIDQEMKYEVRDKVITLTGDELKNKKTKLAAKEYITDNLKIIEEETRKIVATYGKDYEVRLKQGKIFFPDKYYGNQFYTSGKYDALKIEIGEARGNNWWCVMFPPLCIVAFEDEAVADGDVQYKSFLATKYLELKEEKNNEKKKTSIND